MKSIIKSSLVFVSFSISSSLYAGVIELEELGLFVNANGWTESAGDMQIGDPLNNFGSRGLGISYSSSLNSENVGTVTWRVENNSGVTLNDVRVFSYLNADIDFSTNTFYNEHASYIGNTSAQSFEIDEPGYVFGDIFQNLLAGSLDNSNAITSQSPEDVSFALGFNLGDFGIGSWFEATVEISLSDIGGIEHIDSDSNFSFFSNTFLTRSAVAVSEPSVLSLFFVGVLVVV